MSYFKALAERIQNKCSPHDIRTIFTSSSALRRYLFYVKPPTAVNTTKNSAYSIPCVSSKVYKDDTCYPLKINLEEHLKGVVRGEIVKSENIWKKKGKPSALWDEVKIIENRDEHWRIKRLKKSARILGYSDLLS